MRDQKQPTFPSASEANGAANRLLRSPRNIAIATATTTTCVGVIDQFSFTRECICRSLQATREDIAVLPFATFQEALQKEIKFDVFLYYWHCYQMDDEIIERHVFPFEEAKTLAPVLLLTSIDHPRIVLGAFQKGISGFVPIMNTSVKLLLEIIRLVMAGGTFVPMTSLSLTTTMRQDASIIRGDDTFTTRERAVLSLLKNGKANKIIAHELAVSESTVKVHVRSIMRKMKASNRTEAVSRAYAAQLTSLNASRSLEL